MFSCSILPPPSLVYKSQESRAKQRRNTDAESRCQAIDTEGIMSNLNVTKSHSLPIIEHERLKAKKEEKEKEELVFKVLVLGEVNAGKTSLIRRYVDEKFSRGYKPTMGADFNQKIYFEDSKTRVRMQLWDIAGQERFGSFTRVYYKDAISAIIVFDMDTPQSLQTAIKWKQDIDEKVTLSNGEPLPVILLGNKSDLILEKEWARSMYTKEYFASFCKDYGFIAWFTTSCITGANIETPFKYIGEKVLKRQIPLPSDRRDSVIRVSTSPSSPSSPSSSFSSVAGGRRRPTCCS